MADHRHRLRASWAREPRLRSSEGRGPDTASKSRETGRSLRAWLAGSESKRLVAASEGCTSKLELIYSTTPQCDRTHPVCEKCIEDGRQCIYVDNDSTLNDDDCSEDPRPATTGSAGPSSRGVGDGGEGGPLGGGSLERGPGEAFYERRRAGVRHSYDLSRSRHLPFQERVKAARAAAVSEVSQSIRSQSDTPLCS